MGEWGDEEAGRRIRDVQCPGPGTLGAGLGSGGFAGVVCKSRYS